jgi:hypothetical protein
MSEQSLVSVYRVYSERINNIGCFEKSFAMVFQMLLSGECYENVYT